MGSDAVSILLIQVANEGALSFGSVTRSHHHLGFTPSCKNPRTAHARQLPPKYQS